MKKVLATLSYGEFAPIAEEFTIPLIKKYASRVGADLVFLEPTYQSFYDKMGIKELLDTYDKVLYLDTDVLVRPDCPNLFEIVPDGKLGMFNEGIVLPYDQIRWRLDELAMYAHRFCIPIPEATMPDYYNAGVIVADKSHVELFDLPPVPMAPDIVSDQPWLNIQIKITKNFPVCNLPSCFNCMCMWWDANFIRTSYILHFAGPPPKDKAAPIKMYSEHWKKTFPEMDWS